MIAGNLTRDTAVEIAAAISFGICRDAIWSDECCTWLEPIAVTPPHNPAVSATCSPNVYGGTAGIGWVLAQAAAKTSDVLIMRTARAALRQTAARSRTLLTTVPHGFYGGAAGAAAALILAGKTIEDEQAIADGLALLLSIPPGTNDPLEMDLVSGLAGTVLALTVAGAALDKDDTLLARAGNAAETLVDCGERGQGETLSWKTMPNCAVNLLGFAHGTSGIAHALLTLSAVTREDRWKAAALDAIAYESAAFNPARGLWPDFRSLPNDRLDEPAFPVAWCHGAAGIVRCRLTAAASNINVDEDLEVGIAAVVEQSERVLHLPGADVTLCHGLLGLTDALIDCAHIAHVDHSDSIIESASLVASVFDDELPWPSGLPSREPAHGLMLGDAGIAHVFLRLADPTRESVLAPGTSLVADHDNKPRLEPGRRVDTAWGSPGAKGRRA